MSKIFISYVRESEPLVKTLEGDIEGLGHIAWFDHELTGGQVWWDQILEQIRGCDVFVFVLAPRALESDACEGEWQYAHALGKPILPVLVAEGVATALLPGALSAIQYVDYRNRTPDSAIQLAKALARIPAAKPLPELLPTPPEVPVSYLGGLAARIAAKTLSKEEQLLLVADLRDGLRNPASAEDSRALLLKLKKHPDLRARTEKDINELLVMKKDESQLKSEPQSRGFKNSLMSLSIGRLSLSLSIVAGLLLVAVVLPVFIGTRNSPGTTIEPVSPGTTIDPGGVIVPQSPVDRVSGSTSGGTPGAGASQGPEPPAVETSPVGTVILNDLMWAVEDNGRDVNWVLANAYCDVLTLGEYTDWSLATVTELTALSEPTPSYVPRGGTDPVHVRNPIQLTGYHYWTSELDGTGLGWVFNFSRGRPAELPVGGFTNQRALCVRVP